MSHDPVAANVLIEIGPLVSLPAYLAGRALLSRHPDTLASSARLVASPYRQGRVFGAYVIEGTPAPDDEVVLMPSP